jgi:branched-chain amino acid transport system substrate-binding protein
MKKHIACSLFILVLFLVVAGCSPAATPQTPSNTDSAPPEIRIGLLGALTGPTSAVVLPLVQELELFLRYSNEVEGGVDGAKFKWRTIDTKGTPDGAIMAYKELRDGFKPVVYMAIEDYLYTGIKDTINEDKAVFITPAALDSKLYVPPGRFFSAAISTADGFGGYARWVKENWKGTGQPKIGVLYWDRASGLQWKPAEQFVKNLGIELVPVSYPIASMELKPQILTLRDAGVNHIWMLGIAGNNATAIRDFRALELFGKIPFTFNEYSEGETELRVAGPSIEGFYDYRAESPYSEGSAAAKYYTQVWKWGKGEDKWSEDRINVTIQKTIIAAIKQAKNDVGWKKLDSEAFYNAMTKLTTVDTGGNVKDFGFGPNKRVGVSTIKIKKFTATSTVAASDWIKLPRIFEGIDK